MNRSMNLPLYHRAKSLIPWLGRVLATNTFVVNGLTGLWTDGSRTRKGLLKTETSGYAVIQMR